MNLNFHINPSIPLKKIHDSMQLDSGTVIAHLEVNKFDITLEVQGDVRVIWNPNPDESYEKGEVYRTPSSFPDELMRLFESGKYPVDMKNLYICDNNWFNLVVKKGDSIFTDELAECDALVPNEIFNLMWDAYIEARNKEESERLRDLQILRLELKFPDGTIKSVVGYTTNASTMIPPLENGLPDDFSLYHIRHSADNNNHPITLEKEPVTENFAGFFICRTDLDAEMRKSAGELKIVNWEYYL